jgi:hypothetical protein
LFFLFEIKFINFLFSEPSLSLVEAPALAPQEFQIDPNQIREMENEIEAAANAPIDDAEDDKDI